MLVLIDSFQVKKGQGSVIFFEGEPGDCAYIVEQGEVDLFSLINGESVKLTQFGEGELFGEMSLIDNHLRSGTAIAATDVSLLKIPRDFIERNINQTDQIVDTLLKVVLNRYREMKLRLEHVARGKTVKETSLEFKKGERSQAFNTQSTATRIQQENNLHQAFTHNQLELFYQPIVSLTTGKIAGCESLLRWRHPERGLVPPVEFIGIAEDSGLIVPIGKWILKEACQARNKFSQIIEDIYVSINLSPKQFESDELVDDIAEIFVNTKVKTDKIYLEITETTLMSDPIHVANILNDIKALNTIIALDDFGTGYSSFSYLHRFPIDILKIDQSFVFTMMVNQKSNAIVRTLCSLAKSLDMKIVAEGIEQQEEITELGKFEADFGQGYLIAKPMPEAEFIEFLEKNK